MKKNQLITIALGAAILGIAISKPALSREWKKTYSIAFGYDGPVCIYLAPWQGNLNIDIEWANFHAPQNLNNFAGIAYALSVPVNGSLDRILVVKTDQSLTVRFEPEKCKPLPNFSTEMLYLNWQNKPGKN